MNASFKSRIKLVGRLGLLLICFSVFFTAASGCDEYQMLYGSDGGGGWYDYGFTTTYSDGSSSSFSLNPYTDVSSELDNYFSDSWTTTY